MKETPLQTNQESFKDLLTLVAMALAVEGHLPRVVGNGPIEVNCFSLCFWVDLHGINGLRSVYVKIPKVVMFKKEREEILPLLEDDRKLAEDEYHSLVQLTRLWRSDDIDVRYVQPLGFIEEYNAIITERFFAEHFFKVCRRQDTREKLRLSTGGRRASSYMLRLGKALARFHDHSSQETKFDGDQVLGKIDHYLSEIREYGMDIAYLDSVRDSLEEHRGFLASIDVTPNLKGFDVRQVFVDDEQRLILLDPGKIKNGHREVDLARFIVTCRILYWGSLAIIFRLTPNPRFEKNFLCGYGAEKKVSEKVLRMLVIKELFKHWRMACYSLYERPWPRLCHDLLRKGYINRFYKSQVTAELAKL